MNISTALEYSKNTLEKHYGELPRMEMSISLLRNSIEEMTLVSRKLLNTLPPHWHDETTAELRDMVENIEKFMKETKK